MSHDVIKLTSSPANTNYIGTWPSKLCEPVLWWRDILFLIFRSPPHPHFPLLRTSYIPTRELFPTDSTERRVLSFCVEELQLCPCVLTPLRRFPYVTLDSGGGRGGRCCWRNINSSKYRAHCITNPVSSAHTVYLCVPYGSHNKQRLFPYTALTGWAL
jgi:hypothetical protein